MPEGLRYQPDDGITPAGPVVPKPPEVADAPQPAEKDPEEALREASEDWYERKNHILSLELVPKLQEMGEEEYGRLRQQAGAELWQVIRDAFQAGMPGADAFSKGELRRALEGFDKGGFQPNSVVEIVNDTATLAMVDGAGNRRDYRTEPLSLPRYLLSMPDALKDKLDLVATETEAIRRMREAVIERDKVSEAEENAAQCERAVQEAQARLDEAKREEEYRKQRADAAKSKLTQKGLNIDNADPVLGHSVFK